MSDPDYQPRRIATTTLRDAMRWSFELIQDRYCRRERDTDHLCEMLLLALRANPDSTVVFSPGLNIQSFSLRAISRVSGVSIHSIESGRLHDDHWPLITNAMTSLMDQHVLFDADPELDLESFRRRIEKWLSREQLGAFVLDCSPWMEVADETNLPSISEVMEVAGELKKRFPQLSITAGCGQRR